MVEPIYMYLLKFNYFLDETHLFQSKNIFLGLNDQF